MVDYPVPYELPCGPGAAPTWVIPPIVPNEPARAVWATPEEILNGCSGCNFVLGPAIPNPSGIPPTTVPWEIIQLAPGTGPNHTTPTGTPTGISALRQLGYATWILSKFAEQRGFMSGLCLDRRRPPCFCGCAPCQCGVSIDRTWLPDDTWDVTEIVIDGIVLPRIAVPIELLTVSPADPAIAVVAPIGTTGFDVTMLGEGETDFATTWNTPAGIRTETVHVHCNRWLGAGTNSLTAQGPVGATVQYRLPERYNWQVTRDSEAHTWLERLWPYSTCALHTATRTGGCGCDTGLTTPDLHPSNWPQRQRRDLPATEACTWQISILRGRPVADIGRLAAATLACDLIKMAIGDTTTCKLPRGLTRLQRGGVTLDLKATIDSFSIDDFFDNQHIKMWIELEAKPARGWINLWDSDPEDEIYSEGGIWPSSHRNSPL